MTDREAHNFQDEIEGSRLGVLLDDGTRDEILKSIASEYKLYSHKAYKFAQMIQRLRRIRMYSEIPGKVIEAANLRPTYEPHGGCGQLACRTAGC